MGRDQTSSFKLIDLRYIAHGRLAYFDHTEDKMCLVRWKNHQSTELSVLYIAN
jgi:hypothetical protein